MDTFIGSGMSALDESKSLIKPPVIFPTVEGALQLVLDKLKKEYGEIIATPAEGGEAGQWPGLPPDHPRALGGTYNTVRRLEYTFEKNRTETRKRLAIRCGKTPTMKSVKTTRRIAGVPVGTHTSPRLLESKRTEIIRAQAQANLGAALGAGGGGPGGAILAGILGLGADDGAVGGIEEALVEMINEAQQNEYNWKEAWRQRLSPRLYFYGYTTLGGIAGGAGDIGSGLTLCAISEAYDEDIESFYNSHNWDPGQGINNEISRQFTELFKGMASEMKMICFDIKPRNAVINYDATTGEIDVKLIDWDADMCKQYTQLKPWAINYAAILMEMIMAMFFYQKGNNIFSNHLNTVLGANPARPRDQAMRRSLKTLFCSENLKDFAAFAMHYFIGGALPEYDRRYLIGSGELLPEPGTVRGEHYNTTHVRAALLRRDGMDPHICGVLFDSIYERVIFRNHTAYNNAVPQGNAVVARERPVRGIATGSPARRRVGARHRISQYPTHGHLAFGAPGTPAEHDRRNQQEQAGLARYGVTPLSVMHTPPQEAMPGGGGKRNRKKYRTYRKKRKKRSRTRRKRTRTRRKRTRTRRSR